MEKWDYLIHDFSFAKHSNLKISVSLRLIKIQDLKELSKLEF